MVLLSVEGAAHKELLGEFGESVKQGMLPTRNWTALLGGTLQRSR